MIGRIQANRTILEQFYFSRNRFIELRALKCVAAVANGRSAVRVQHSADPHSRVAGSTAAGYLQSLRVATILLLTPHLRFPLPRLPASELEVATQVGWASGLRCNLNSLRQHAGWEHQCHASLFVWGLT